MVIYRDTADLSNYVLYYIRANSSIVVHPYKVTEDDRTLVPATDNSN